jgi:hypothetical protein
MKLFSGKRAVMVCLAVAAVMLLPLTAQAVVTLDMQYSFVSIPTTVVPAGNALIGVNQFKVDVIATGSDFAAASASHDVMFKFTNLGPTQSTISEIYFYDGTLFNNTVPPGGFVAPTLTYSGPGISFGLTEINPGNLPGDNNYFGNIHVPQPALVFAADPGSTAPDNGVNPSGEWVAFSFSLPNTTYADILTALGTANTPNSSGIAAYIDGTLVLGIHGVNFASGDSVSFVNTPNGTVPPPVPVPPTVWLMGSGMVGLALLGWRRRKQ